jgi:hypothetical protein
LFKNSILFLAALVSCPTLVWANENLVCIRRENLETKTVRTTHAGGYFYYLPKPEEKGLCYKILTGDLRDLQSLPEDSLAFQTIAQEAVDRIKAVQTIVYYRPDAKIESVYSTYDPEDARQVCAYGGNFYLREHLTKPTSGCVGITWEGLDRLKKMDPKSEPYQALAVDSIVDRAYGKN